MSVGPGGMQLGGVLPAAAGTSLSQRAGDSEQAQQATAAGESADRLSMRAERAAGIGATDADQQAGDRDADGRQLLAQARHGTSQPAADDADEAGGERPPADPSGLRGRHIDLTG